MASPQKRPQRHHDNYFQFLHSTTTAFLSPPKTAQSPPSKICVPLLFRNSSIESSQPDSLSSSNPASVKDVPSGDSGSGFPSTVRIAGLNSNGKGGGPAFVGQVFSMCDLSGTGLMAVSTHFDIPFISKRTPEWLKKMFATVTKSERNGPVFRFFMDLGDAVTYVKKLNIPSGVVGACRLDLAYEHFKEKPHLFQFVPNERQVKAANKILRKSTQYVGNRRVDGVPVFSARNLDIAIATTDGIKWYTPYFFDKNMLDNILEDSVDQHFNGLIQTRNMQRRRDVVDDNMAADVLEEIGDSLLEPPEIQEVMDEMGHSGLPLSVISKAAEIQLLYAVDKVLLGNRWLRKATGIQPKFPYMVDSFEKRSAFSIKRASESTNSPTNSEREDGCSELALEDNVGVNLEKGPDFQFPFGDWLRHPWLKQQFKPQKGSDRRAEGLPRGVDHDEHSSPFLPKITMVGISTGEVGQMSKASLKKTMEDLTRELEQTEQGSSSYESSSNEYKFEDRDPLFVANVGDYYSRMGRMAKAGSARWVGQGND